MTKSELVLEVAKRADISPKESERLVRTVLEVIQDSIVNGEKITLSGFGTFERRRRKETFARNPKTGETMRIDAQNVATFRAGSALKEAVKASV